MTVFESSIIRNMKVGYYIRTDIQHIPPIMRVYEHLGGIIFTKNEDIAECIEKHYAHLNPEVILLDHRYIARYIAYKKGVRIMVYTGYQFIYWGYAVQVFHGVSDKRYVEDPRMQCYDRILLPGLKTKEKIENAGYVKHPEKLVLVGYPKFDDVINDKLEYTPLFDNGKPTILYAPTWVSQWDEDIEIVFSPYGESSLPLWGKRLVEAIPPRWNLIIKYHARVPENSQAIYDEINNCIKERGFEDNVKVVWDANIAKYMHQADLMITDISTVAYEWLHFDRPIVYANPSPENYRPSEDKFSNTYAWRAGDVLYKEEEIVPTIEKNLTKDEYKGIREELLHYAFHQPDGKATERQIEAIRKLYEETKDKSVISGMFHNLCKAMGIYRRV